MGHLKRFIMTGLTVIASCGFMTFTGKLEHVRASVRTQKMTSIPKNYQGKWYSKDGKRTLTMKVSTKKFGASKYNKNPGNVCGGAYSEKYFHPYKVLGAKANTMYFINGSGIQTIRKTTVNKQPVLLQYSQQDHNFRLVIWTKARHSKIQSFKVASNPFGMGITSLKAAKANKKFYDKINPTLKKYYGKALKKKQDKGFGKMKSVTVTYYDALFKYGQLK